MIRSNTHKLLLFYVTDYCRLLDVRDLFQQFYLFFVVSGWTCIHGPEHEMSFLPLSPITHSCHPAILSWGRSEYAYNENITQYLVQNNNFLHFCTRFGSPAVYKHAFQIDATIGSSVTNNKNNVDPSVRYVHKLYTLMYWYRSSS